MSRMRFAAALLCVLTVPAYAQVQGQAYEKNSMTSTLSCFDAACGGVNSS